MCSTTCHINPHVMFSCQKNLLFWQELNHLSFFLATILHCFSSDSLNQSATTIIFILANIQPFSLYFCISTNLTFKILLFWGVATSAGINIWIEMNRFSWSAAQRHEIFDAAPKVWPIWKSPTPTPRLLDQIN